MIGRVAGENQASIYQTMISQASLLGKGLLSLRSVDIFKSAGFPMSVVVSAELCEINV